MWISGTPLAHLFWKRAVFRRVCRSIGASTRRQRTTQQSGDTHSRSLLFCETKSFGSQQEFAVLEISFLPSIRAVRLTISPKLQRFDTPARSSTQASDRHPSARAAHKVQPHPNETLSRRSIPALAGPVSALRCERALRPLDVLDPKTAALGDQQFAPTC